jgi:hypothetical protein
MQVSFITRVLIFILSFSLLVSPVDAETLNTDLTLGSTGSDVAVLQQFLVVQGLLQMPVL